MESNTSTIDDPLVQAALEACQARFGKENIKTLDDAHYYSCMEYAGKWTKK